MKTILSRLRCLLAFAFVTAFTAQVHAAITTFNDKSAFLAATGATSATGDLPGGSLPLGMTVTSATVGSVTFTAGPGSVCGAGHTMHFVDWSARLPGNELAVCAMEHLNMDLAVPVFALGFDFVEPKNDPNINAPFADSSFTVSLFNGGVLVGSFTFNAPEDTAYFVGVSSDTAFNRIEIRETAGGIENEFFGQVYTLAAPTSNPPPPAVNIGITTFNSKNAFLAATGATSATGDLPGGSLPLGMTVTSATAGSVTFTAGPGSVCGAGHTMHFVDWSARLPGNELAVCAMEHLNMDLAAPVFALGFDFVEPKNDPNINAPFADSSFTVSLFNGGVLVGSFTFNAPEDTAYFVGVSLDTAFNRVEIRETTGGIENEFFGQVYTSAFNSEAQGNVTLSTSSLSLTEGGVQGTYTMVLSIEPTADVVVTVSPDAQLNASPTQLTFTSANWNTPQTVTVQAIQDGIVEGNHSGTISHAATSADARYNSITVGSVMAAITDAVIPTVSVSVPPGTIWIQPDLPVTGTASPGATVTLAVTNLSTGEARAMSAVANADGNWSLTLTGLTDGTYELQPEAGGITGSKVTVAVDSHAPVSTLSVTSNNGPAASGWYTGAVNLAVAAADGVGGAGVERSESMLDGSAWTSLPATGLTVSADGNHNFCYRSVDKAGNVEAARCAPVPIDATSPQVNPAFDTASNLLHLNAQDSVSGIAGIEISRDGGQSWTAQSGPVGFTRDGTYTVQYRVRDVAGNLASGQTTVNVVTIPNITAPSDQTASEAASQSFNLGSFSDQAADNPWNIDVDWGDGSAHNTFTLNAPGTLGALPHAYLDNGMYTVTIKVMDQAGNTGSKSFTITVTNVAPTAMFTTTSGPLNEGDIATLAFSNPIDPSPIDTQAGFRYAFDCGSGYGAASAASSVTCAALDNPSLTVKGRVIDKDGGATEYSAVIAINNVAPILGAATGPTSPVQRDTPATITVDFTDPGVRDTHTAMIDWDDGAVSAGTVTEANGSGSISASHSYAKPGRYVVTVTVTDKDGASAITTYNIQVRGGPPAR